MPAVDYSLDTSGNMSKVAKGNAGFASSMKFIHNPLSAAMDILDGNHLTGFDMIANGNYSENVVFKYRPFGSMKDFMIVDAEFEKPIIKGFRRIYALCFNNIPVSGYIHLVESDVDYMRGELADVKICGKSILKEN
jgi:hypothetical protein